MSDVAIRVEAAPAEPPPADERPRDRLSYRVAARTLDLVAGTIALIPAAPVLVVAALAIRVTSRGPIFFRQERVGYRGEAFTMLKLRTMHADNDDSAHRAYVRAMFEQEHPLQLGALGLYKLHDDRVTAVGRLLRRTSIDELPQLFNVLRGEMSLVGPRPALPCEVPLFTHAYAVRFNVKPGMTGLWQVSGRSQLTMREALELDRRYVLQHSLVLDVKILLKTIKVVLSLRDAA